MKYLLALILVFPLICFSQTHQQKEKNKKAIVFAQIYAGFYHDFGSGKPQTAFVFNQGILGYSNEVSEKLSAKILFDVTRTTHILDLMDSSGDPVDIEYFEGSKYTAYLKMAEIKWSVTDYMDLRFGQLLNTQYLTFQDKFWGFRYVDVTFQEKYRLGMPADYGAQLDFKIGNKLLNQTTVVNGEGPFRHQSDAAKFLISNNIQYQPMESLTIKLYTDYAPADADTMDSKSLVSFFAGYKSKWFRLGCGYTFVSNYKYTEGDFVNGFSVFAAVPIKDKFNIILRHDNVLVTDNSNVTSLNEYNILGFEYKPDSHLSTSISYRNYGFNDASLIYLNVGAKF